MSLGLIAMATGRYREYLPQLAESAEKHLIGLDRIFIASDEDPRMSRGGLDIQWLRWPQMAWPLPTLLRYHMMTLYRDHLQACDQLLYLDVDMRVVADVEVPGHAGLVGVVHPGHQDGIRRRFPYETRPSSAAYVSSQEGVHYFCGGVQGGDAVEYLNAAATMADRVDRDMRRGVTPRWHDESVWNRYLCDNPPRTVWGSEYCTPDSQPSESARILALTKDHALVRAGQSHGRLRAVLGKAQASARAHAGESLYLLRRPLGR